MRDLLLASVPTLALVATLAAASTASAQGPDLPGSAGVQERRHDIEVQLGERGATLIVTRSMFNASLFHGQVELPIPLPCEATLDDVRIEERDAQGQTAWRAAEIVESEVGWQRWAAWISGPQAGTPTALDADTALLVTRDHYRCAAQLSLYPVPPAQTRTVSYRVFIPSSYDDGQHHITLPNFDEWGLVGQLELAAVEDAAGQLHELSATEPWSLEPNVEITVDDQALTRERLRLDGAATHHIQLRRRDGGRGHASAVDLDLDALVAGTPAAARKRAANERAAGHLLASSFELPRELAKLPALRRVVVLLDSSRSLDAHERRELQNIGADYLASLASEFGPQVRAEIMLFDRTARPLYSGFVRSDWAAEDLRNLDVAVGNGSELGVALDAARDSLSAPTNQAGVDWIIALSDVELRRDFSIEAERMAAADSTVRLHVVRSHQRDRSLRPGPADDAWTAVAREAGGMLWDWGVGGYESEALAAELIRPRRLWSPRLELVFASGERREISRNEWMGAGQSDQWRDATPIASSLSHAAWVGEVWGQRRAWTATPSDDVGKQLAGALATHDDDLALSTAVRTALAVHAAVISPFTSAWAVAGFDGPASAPQTGFGLGMTGGSSSMSTRCGGSRGVRVGRSPNAMTFAQLAQVALDRCANKSSGSFAFETTDLEIVSVESLDACVGEQLWATDISPTDSHGRVRVTATYAAGQLTELTKSPL